MFPHFMGWNMQVESMESRDGNREEKGWRLAVGRFFPLADSYYGDVFVGCLAKKRLLSSLDWRI